MTGKWSLDIDCANCAAKLEDALSRVPGVEQVRIDFMRRTITLTAQDSEFEKVTQAVLARAKQVEPDAVIHTEAHAAQHDRHHHDHHHDAGCDCAHQHDHHHGEGCSCGHDHDREAHCSCGHDHHEHDHDHHDHHDHDHHGHDHGNSDHGRVLLCRVGAAAVLLVLGLVTSGWISTALFVLAYLAAGYDVLLGAGRNILRGKVFDENFLMSVASVGAMLMGDFAEGVAVMTLYQLGEYFQDKAVDKSRASIAGLMDIRPDYANLLQADGSARQVSPEDVEIGDTILVKPGERVPLDGQVVSGASTLDTMALTGESLPREVGPGDSVISGCVNESAVLTVRVTTRYGESTVAKILELVERSGQAKAKTERFITRFARVYTPLVCMAAVLLAVVPSLLDGQWMEWIRRALTFLVISCPCALVISVPLTFFSGIGAASRRGILIKGANHLEALAEVDTVVFDKTGTLTRGVFTVTGVYPEDGDEAALLETAALAECWSDHPISRSLQTAWGKEMDPARVTDAQEIAGHGVKAVVDGRVVHAGNSRLMAQLGLQTAACGESGTVVHVAQDNRYMGYIVLGDVLKPTAQQAVTALKAEGVKRLVMLTGDRRAAAEETARQLGLTDVHAELLPGDKVGRLERILKDAAGGRTAFCGDGINDAPVLRRADVGVAMGALGSDAAIEAADVVLMDDDPLKMAGAIRVARGTMRIAWQNIVFSLGVKLLVMLLGALGIANMWLAVFADVGVCMLAILNATRAGFGSGKSKE